MFSSSVRRAALTAPQIPIVSSLSSAAPRVAASQSLSRRSHQRRYSSSKPSSPADGSKGVSQRQNVPPATAQSGPDSKDKASAEFSSSSSQVQSSEAVDEGQKAPSDGEKILAAESGKKPSTRGSRRKSAKSDVKDGEMRNVPIVPSTQHIPAGQICASSFFSLHRPISLTQAYPKPVTDSQFDAIFKPRLAANPNSSEVISTLSSTLNTLDSLTDGMRQMRVGQQDQWNPETDELRAAITAESYRKAEAKHLDQPPADSSPFAQHLSGRYQPFNPPPAPVPTNTADSLAAGAEAAKSMEPQQKTYTAVLTIEESTDANGEVTYMAHSSPFVAEDPPTVPSRFLERMKIRQERYEEYREQRSEESGMEAISVKRQRKLKMKKHKYKKLMRRTRNLRRRLDRN